MQMRSLMKSRMSQASSPFHDHGFDKDQESTGDYVRRPEHVKEEAGDETLNSEPRQPGGQGCDQPFCMQGALGEDTAGFGLASAAPEALHNPSEGADVEETGLGGSAAKGARIRRAAEDYMPEVEALVFASPTRSMST
jgi:hypothetical protein